MNAQEEEAPGLGSSPDDLDPDPLRERKVRRVEVPGDPILIRRAETAEAAAQALEEHLSSIQARLRDAEQECAQASRRLGEREHELRLASERLATGERELRTVTHRLTEREDDMRVISQRLAQREQELGALTERLVVRETDLRRAELEIKGRLDGLEGRILEVQRELAEERGARESAERELAHVRAALRRTEALVGDLKELARRLRDATQSPGGPPSPGEGPGETPSAGDVGPPSDGGATETSSQLADEQAKRAQMADALASAVERLRARVAAVGEMHDQRAAAQTGAAPSAQRSEQPPQAPLATETAPAEARAAAPYVPPPAELPSSAPPWLAAAIRRVAQRREPRLAGELVLEMLPAQARALSGTLRYLARIAELGQYTVTVANGEATVSAVRDAPPRKSVAFILEGSAAAFAEIAAGGLIGKRPAGLSIRRGRLRARRLLEARRAPVTLASLAEAGIAIWPGLLLVALGEAIEPAWTAGRSLDMAFLIEAQEPTRLHLQVRDGQPVRVSRPAVEVELRPDASVRLGERAFMAMFAGVELPEGCEVQLEGEVEALETLLQWTDRVQGIRRSRA